MKKPKLQHNYHDAHIRKVTYRENHDIVLDVDLCGCGNPQGASAHLTFFEVSNFEQVRGALEQAENKNRAFGYVDEIVGIIKDGKQGHLLDLSTAGDVTIYSKGIFET